MKLVIVFAFTATIILVGILFETLVPRCTASSPEGVAIGGVLRIGGCP